MAGHGDWSTQSECIWEHDMGRPREGAGLQMEALVSESHADAALGARTCMHRHMLVV